MSYQEIERDEALGLVGLDGKLLGTPEDFKRDETYCSAKIAMH